MIRMHENEIVTCDKNGQTMTLKDVFRSMNLTAYDLTVDMLDVHAVSSNRPVYINVVNKCCVVGGNMFYN